MSYDPFSPRCSDVAYIGSTQDVPDILSAGVEKEFNAGQELFSYTQLLDYSSLFGVDPYKDWSPHIPITPAWVSEARWFADSIIDWVVQSDLLLFPKVQRRKNVSQSTSNKLYSLGYRSGSRGRYELRTIDLELYYFETGVKIDGECELRWAWRFNDLKPRAYYCIGGKLYWCSRYMKKIAQALMEKWPITHHLRRRYPDDLSKELSPDLTIVLWDYRSFTSTLSELRFFLYWTARFIESSPFTAQNPIALFDYKEGIVYQDLHTLIDDYNETVNIHAEYSIHRLIDDMNLPNQSYEDSIHTMKNSGPLGVPGNIGFSTSVHGLHTGAGLKDKNKGVCVGDDALGMPKNDEVEQFVEHISYLGDIHKDKFDFLRHRDYDIEVSKFLKRRAERNGSTFWIDKLYDFPIMALVLDIRDDFHTLHNLTSEDRLCKFLMQVSSLYLDLSKTGQYCDDDEYLIIRQVLMLGYRQFHIPSHGGLPYTWRSNHFKSGVCPLAIPPITGFDARCDDWLESIWWNHKSSSAELPWFTEQKTSIEYFRFIGQEYRGTTNFLMLAMEDLGVITKKALRQVVALDERNLRMYKKFFLRKSFLLYDFTYVTAPPTYFNDILDKCAPRAIEYSPYSGFWHADQVDMVYNIR